MGSFSFSGIDDALDELRKMGEDVDRLGPAAALAGAQAAVAEMEKTVPVRTGGLKGHIAIDGPHHTLADGHFCDVYPTGTKKNGRKRERYETVGFVLEYGRSNMPANPWMRTAVEQNADAIADAMAEALSSRR